jgi:hypothetical protein
MYKISQSWVFLLAFFIIVGILIDTSLIKISVFTGGLDPSFSGILPFISLTLVFVVGQFFILIFMKQLIKMHKSTEKIWTYDVVLLIEITIIVMFIIVIAQMILKSYYSSIVFKLIIDINYGIAIILFGLMAKKFFTWFRNKKNLILAFYAITVSVICLNLICTLTYVMNSLTGQRGLDYIVPIKGLMSIIVGANNLYSNLYFITSVASFCLIWFCTILLLHNYSPKIGITRYLLLLAIPFVYFLGEFQPFLINLFDPIRILDPIIFGVSYTLFFSAAKPIGGILFGIVLWSIGKSSKSVEFRDYMTISAIGMMILVTANQPSGLVLAPYPPFGLVTISFLGLASYLFFTGISYSALSVANRKELRLSIKKSFGSSLNLIHDIGAAHMEENVQKTVKKINSDLSEKIADETGVYVSLDDKEIKDMIQEIIKEAKLSKQRKT